MFIPAACDNFGACPSVSMKHQWMITMKIFASRDEKWRIDRVQKAIRIATAMCGLSADQAEMLISEVADNKGILRVCWLTDPTMIQRHAFSVAWEQCKEMACNVQHVTSTAAGEDE